jgi:hypothetical protein
MLFEGGGPLRHSDASECVGQGGPRDDDEGDCHRNHPEIRKADPENQLIGSIGGDVEHTPEQARLSPGASHDAVHRVQHQPQEQQSHPGQPYSRRSEIQDQDGHQEQRKARERNPVCQHGAS